MHRYRSHTCGALRESNIGDQVRLSANGDVAVTFEEEEGDR